MQHFCSFDSNGETRETPIIFNLAHSGGVETAIHFLTWMGENMPGFEYTQKMPTLSVEVFKGARTGIANKYKDDLMAASLDAEVNQVFLCYVESVVPPDWVLVC